MKAKAMARIILYTILLVLLVFILCAGLGLRGVTLMLGTGGSQTAEGTVTADAGIVQNIEIYWAAGTVEIQSADTGEITFHEFKPDGCKYQMTYDIVGDTLKLYFGNGSVALGFSIPEKHLSITVPRDWFCNYLEIDGASLDAVLTGLNVTTIKLNAASCDLDFTGNVDRVEVNGASTDVSLVCKNRASTVELNGASCDLALTLPKNCGFRVEMNGVSCDLHSDLPYAGSSGHAAYGDEHCQIKVNGASCGVTIAEGEECAHQWGPGMPTVDADTGESKMQYTCMICGEHTFQILTPIGYPIFFADEFTSEMLLEPLAESYFPGQTVTLKTDILCDADLHLYVNGEFVCSQTTVDTEDGYIWEFYFTMPAENVVIDFVPVEGFLPDPEA